MGEWERLVQEIVEYLDECIKKRPFQVLCKLKKLT